MTPIEQALQWGAWVEAYLWWVGGGALVLVCVVAWVAGRVATASVSHGSARFGTLREARMAGLVGSRGFVIGIVQGKTLHALRQHVLLCGPTGTRKDRSHNFPTTIGWPWSLLIVDIKDGGENYILCRRWRQRLGPVVRFSPAQRQSACYNLLDAVRWGRPEEFRDVSVIVESLLAPRKKVVQSSDSGAYFAAGAFNTLRAVTLHAGHQGVAHFPGVLALMADPTPCLRGMAQSAHQSVRQVGTELRAMQTDAERQFQGLWDTAKRGLDLFRDPLIAAHSVSSDVRLVDLQYGARPMTLYLGAESPTDLLYLYPLYRALLQSTYHLLTSVPQHAARQRWPLGVLGNEFTELGWMSVLERAPAHARSYDIWLWIVVQDLGQLWDVYGKDTPLAGNLMTQIYHTPVHDETAERLARRLGKQTIQVSSMTYGQYRSQNRQETGRDLMTAAEVLGMDGETVLVWSQGLPHPLRCTKVPYWEG